MEVKLLEETKKFMTDSESKATDIVEGFKQSHKIKKSSIVKKVKKNVEYWIVTVTLEVNSEKELFEIYLAEE